MNEMIKLNKYYIMLFLIFVSCSYRGSYKEKKDRIDEILSYDIFGGLYGDYFIENGYFPQNNSVFFEKHIGDSIFDIYVNNFLIDPLNKENKLFCYIPIYNRLNSNRDGFLLLSAGIDGKLNISNLKDTIYEDEIHNVLKLYNDNYYSLFKKKIGKKDLMIYFLNGIGFIKTFRYKAVSDSVLTNLLISEKQHHTRKLYKYYADDFKDTVINNDDYIIIYQNDYLIKNKLHH